MIVRPNLQLIYVSDIEKSMSFYNYIFAVEPIFVSPRYVAYTAAKDNSALFALWTGTNIFDSSSTKRNGDIGLMLESEQDINIFYKKLLQENKVKLISEPKREVFGLTFSLSDPDNNLIRVCPVD